ncbi:acyl-CoA dehydrogenase [Baekduia soli]|uniref:Acyl-CoA dehydrogenase n=1 Tax=Baekduia soli TaxID=496014 RepID=A0A5B8UBS9_9ACTN|nr:acyl-CoA dehydrogenase [Baekduia soli]
MAIVADDDPFRREFRPWLAEHVPGPEPLDQDAKVALRRAWQRTLSAGGWAGPAWPAEYGGRGAGPLQQFMYYEELALARAPWAANAPGTILLGPTLMVHGTEELRTRFLPAILSGDELFSQGFSEPEAGSDLASLRTRAHRDGDDWVITGQKIWTTWAQYSDWCFVVCRTDPESKRHRGLSMIICPMDQLGVTVRPIEQISGDPEFAEVFFDGARAPAGHVVGEVGQGWAVAMTMLGFERADQGFSDHALLLVHLHDLAAELRAAQRDGRLGAAEAAEARARHADLWIRCQQLRRFNLSIAVRGEAGETPGDFGSVVNLFWADLEQGIAELGVAVAGARGLALGDHPAHFLMSSRSATIDSGSSEIQRNIIAERTLGLPR